MRQMSKPEKSEKQIENTVSSSDVQLVRCSKCGSWIPQNTALKLSKNNFYCSSKCLETAVKA
jgi:ribosomal protein S26